MAKRPIPFSSKSKQTKPAVKQRISKRVQEIPASGLRRFFDLIVSTDGIISLGVGEPDFVTPWHVREAAIYSVEGGHTYYTSNLGTLELRSEVSAYLKRLYGLQYDPESEILITVGASEAIDLIMRSTLDPGDEVISADPGYVAYSPIIQLAGGVSRTVPTRVEDGFCLQAEDIAAHITDRSRLLLLNNPSNPTGALLDRKTLEHIAEVAEEHNLLVVSDEIYDRLVYSEEPFVPFASLPGMNDRTVTVGGFSKAFAMTGWRLGYVCAAPDLIAAMMKIHQYTLMCAPTAAQAAAVEALRHGEPDVQEMLEAYSQRRKLLLNGLKNIGLEPNEPQGAFYAFPSVGSTGMTSEEFTEQLLIEEKVAVVPGNAFGPSGEGFIRCCYAVSVGDIEEALERMGRFVSRHS
jgi:aminotransferase